MEPLHFVKTVDLALALQPNTKKVVLIAGSSTLDKSLEWIAREQFKPYEDRLQVEYWEGPTPEEAKELLRGLSADTIVCYLVEYSDHPGEELLRLTVSGKNCIALSRTDLRSGVQLSWARDNQRLCVRPAR